MPNLLNSTGSWFQQLSVMATSECPQHLARANWKAVFISLIELQILWLEWSQIAESTDTWLWQSAPSAPCQVAYPSVFVCNKRAVKICVAGCFNCTKGDPSLVSETLHSHIILQSISLSLANCHPVQCSAKREGCGLRHCLSSQVFATVLSACTPLNPFWNLYKKSFQLPVK